MDNKGFLLLILLLLLLFLLLLLLCMLLQLFQLFVLYKTPDLPPPGEKAVRESRSRSIVGVVVGVIVVLGSRSNAQCQYQPQVASINKDNLNKSV